MEASRRRNSSSSPASTDLTGDNELSLSESDMIDNSCLIVDNSKLRLHPIGNLEKVIYVILFVLILIVYALRVIVYAYVYICVVIYVLCSFWIVDWRFGCF